MSDLKKFIVEVLLEKASGGQKTDVLSKKVMRFLYAKLKSPEVLKKISAKPPESFDIQFSGSEVGIDPSIVNSFVFHVEFDDTLELTYFSADAAYMPADATGKPKIDIELLFPRRFRIEYLADIYSEVLDSVRHELEHAHQKIKPDDFKEVTGLNTIEDFRNYYLDPREIDAFIVGMMARVKSTKVKSTNSDEEDQPIKKLSEMIEFELDKIAEHARDVLGDTKDVEEFEIDLFAEYLGRAKKRYPKMQ